MSEILSRAWTVSHRVEIWLLILVAYLLQRNVNSGHMPTKAVDPEAFMNVVSWGFSCLGGNEGLCVSVCICAVAACYVFSCIEMFYARTVW